MALVLILYPLGYIYDLGRAWTYLPWDYVGELNGSAYYESTSDRANGEGYLLHYLKLQPKGIVAEHPENDFSNGNAMPMFAGQPSYLGWLGHEQLWRGYLPELQYRHDQLESFYAGTMVNEQYFLDLERRVFLELCKEKNTADRIEHMLTTGKPLRN